MSRPEHWRCTRPCCPQGRVLYFGGNERRKEQHDAGPKGWDHTRVWTPANRFVDRVPSPPFDAFCAGHCLLGNGQLLVAGGTEAWFDNAGPIHGPHGHMPGVRESARFDPLRQGLSDQLWLNRQTNTNLGGSWTDWSFFTGPANKAHQLYVVGDFWPSPSVHAFMIGMDYRVWYNDLLYGEPALAWSGWRALGGPSQPARQLAFARHYHDRRVHALMISLDDRIWHSEQLSGAEDARWTDWKALDTAANRARFLTAYWTADSRIIAFMAGLDNRVWFNEQLSHEVGAKWAGWQPFSTAVDRAKSLTVARHRQDGRLLVFMIGMDHQIWHNDELGPGHGAAWTGWNWLSKAGDRAKSLTVVPNADGRLHAFMIGMDDQIWHNDERGATLGSPWTGWNWLSKAGDRAKSLTVVPNADGRLHAFMIGMDDQIWHNDQTGTGLGSPWTGWNWLSQLGDRAKNLSVVRARDGRLHAAAIGVERASWLRTPRMLSERGNPTGGGRWYPTVLTLPSGRALAMGGHPNRADSRHSNFMVELYDPGLNSWIDDGDEPSSVIAAVANRPAAKPEIYPRLHVLPNGDVFCVLLADGKSYLWSPTGGFTPLNAAPPAEMDLSRQYDLNLWGSVLLPLLPGNGYTARVLVAGGMSRPHTFAPLAQNASWQPTQPRQGFAGVPPERKFASLVLLPDGTVLVVGGTQNQADDNYAVLAAEQYNPANNQWTMLASANVPRQYHSTALLLPDGRVWTGGSNPNDGTAREERMEVFSPPYLFRGTRPRIDHSPTSLAWATTFTVVSPDAAAITRVVLIRCGSATHGFDGDQRFVELGIQSLAAGRNELVVRTPPNRNIAPPGYYMLFALNALEVPSVARIVHL